MNLERMEKIKGCRQIFRLAIALYFYVVKQIFREKRLDEHEISKSPSYFFTVCLIEYNPNPWFTVSLLLVIIILFLIIGCW